MFENFDYVKASASERLCRGPSRRPRSRSAGAVASSRILRSWSSCGGPVRWAGPMTKERCASRARVLPGTARARDEFLIEPLYFFHDQDAGSHVVSGCPARTGPRNVPTAALTSPRFLQCNSSSRASAAYGAAQVAGGSGKARGSGCVARKRNVCSSAARTRIEDSLRMVANRARSGRSANISLDK